MIKEKNQYDLILKLYFALVVTYILKLLTFINHNDEFIVANLSNVVLIIIIM